LLSFEEFIGIKAVLIEALFILHEKICLPDFKELNGVGIAKMDRLHGGGAIKMIRRNLKGGFSMETADKTSFSVHVLLIGFFKLFFKERGRIKV